MGPTKFADGTVITVYIPPDPTGGGRESAVAAGILAWNKERPLPIQVKSGNEPAGATNAVQVNWTAPTTGTELGEATVETMEGTNGNTTVGGTIDIDPSTTDVNKTMAKNLGIHEMGHILGLDDTPNTGNAMDPNFNKTKAIHITDEDTLELFSTFAAADGPSSDSVKSTVTYSDGLYKYDYTVNYLSGDALALFQVETNGADLESIEAPTGWAIDKPIGDDVTVDVVGTPQSEQFVSFVLTDEVSYLGPNNPQLDFSFESSAGPGDVQAFLDGDVETVGPVVPEPTCFALTASGLMALILVKRRFRKLLGAEWPQRKSETTHRALR